MADKTEYQLKQLLKYNRDGSLSKQTARLQNLNNGFKHLQEKRGYSKRFDLSKFGKKDMDRLVHDWKERGITHRVIANRLADYRWMVSKLGNADRIPKTNKSFGLRRESLIPKESRALELNKNNLSNLSIRDRIITELRVEFGLRTEEALKFNYNYATKNDSNKIELKGSWTKGGRQRSIEITRDSQRKLLERVKNHQIDNKERSMIPKSSRFDSYYREYNKSRQAAGIPGHELRHQWAQNRFEQVSGFKPPFSGGSKYSDLSENDKKKWDNGARIVNKELGHGKGRQDITATYIGGRE